MGDFGLSDALGEADTVELLRYYIGLVNGKRVSFTVGPGEPDEFVVAAYTPVAGDYWSYYPVSQEIAEEWGGGPGMSDPVFEVSLDMLVYIHQLVPRGWGWRCDIGDRENICAYEHHACTREEAVEDAVSHLNHRHNIFAVEAGCAR